MAVRQIFQAIVEDFNLALRTEEILRFAAGVCKEAELVVAPTFASDTPQEDLVCADSRGILANLCYQILHFRAHFHFYFQPLAWVSLERTVRQKRQR